MFERFTEPARQAIVLAQEEARGLRHNYIGTEHLLLGLLGEGAGQASSLLTSLGISPERVRRTVVRIVGSGDGVTAGQIPFTPRAKRTLELAVEESDALDDHESVGTEHLLLGLLRAGDGVAWRVLVDLGVVPENMRLLLGQAPDEGMLEALARRRDVVAALLAASGRREDVIGVIGAAQTRNEALEGLTALLGISPDQAEDVLDMRLARLTGDEVQRLRDELKEIERRLQASG